MNAFISYSITQSDKYILNLLAKRLSDLGWNLVTGYGSSILIDSQTCTAIKNSALFIGLITNTVRFGDTHVLSEFNYAVQHNKPSILLIEEGNNIYSQYPNSIWFNRSNINRAIREVQKRIDETKMVPNSNPDAAAWLLGGIAVLALLAYLDNKK